MFVVSFNIFLIFIHNEVRDFDKNLTRPKIQVNQVQDNESQLYIIEKTTNFCDKKEKNVKRYNKHLILRITGETSGH
jgi:hypothetical protein